MKTCKLMETFISRRIDNDLDNESLIKLVNHIKVCPACTAVEKQMNNYHTLVRNAKPSMKTEVDMDPMKLVISEKDVNQFQIKKFPVLNSKYTIAALFIACIGIASIMLSLQLKTDRNLGSKLSKILTEEVEEVAEIEEFVEEIDANMPLAMLDYYLSKDLQSNVLLQFSAISETPLSSY